MAVLLLVLLFFPMLVLAIVLWWRYGRGSVFFYQDRLGKGGKVFRLKKFCTMKADFTLPEVERSDAFQLFLRRYGIDELPQLFNILQGEMSFIGPRPLLPEYGPQYRFSESRRMDVLPGITGLAQVKGRNQQTWAFRFAADLYYVRHHGLGLDLYILWQTVIKILNASAQDGLGRDRWV